MKLSKAEANKLLKDMGQPPIPKKRTTGDDWIRSDPEKAKKVQGPQGRNKEFDLLCEAQGVSLPVHEYVFHETRKWRFDYLFDGWLALEVQGGNWQGGRHTRPKALLAEYEKVIAAAKLGFVVIFCTPEQVKSGAIFADLRELLSNGVE